MRRFLAERDRIEFEFRAQISFVSEDPREGHFRLFNRNGHRTTHVRPVEKTPNRYGWIVEVDEPMDPYFRNVLQEIV